MMTGRARWLTLLACCAVVAVSAPIGASATGQARSTAVTANRHAGHQIAALTRCAVRNKAMGTARISGFLGDTQNLNPYQSNPLAGLFESYFVSNNKLKMIPVMASEVPTPKNGGVRDGGKTVVLHLKMGLRWSNGVEITAADARFGWRIDTDKVTGPACGGPCREIRTVQTPGKYTIIYRLKHVTPSFLTDGLPSIWPTRWTGAWKDDPHAAAIKLGTDPTFNFKGPNYPTNGPYQVARVVEGKEVILKPMKYYSTMTCGGSIATLVAEVEGSVARTIAALVAGHLDLWDEAGIIPLPELERHSEYTIHIDPQFALEHLAFNVDPTVNGAANPLHDARVRLALALALDKRLLIRTVLPFSARQARGILAWTPWINTPKLVQQYADTTIRGQWDPIAKAYVSDTGQGKALADARKLLASTRWKKGFTIDLHTSDIGRRRATVPVLTAAWARIGVTVNATIQGGGTLFGSWNNGGVLAHGAFQVALFSTTGSASLDALVSSLGSTYIDRHHTDHSLPAGNISGIEDSGIDHAFAMAGHTVIQNIRRRNYAVIQREVNRQAYWIPLFFVPDVWTTNGHIKNVSYSPRDGLPWDMWAWTVRDR